MGERRRRKWKRERTQRRKKEKSRAEAHGLEKPQVLRDLIDVEDGSVVLDLPNLGAQHVFILTELCFHCPGLFGLEIYGNRSLEATARGSHCKSRRESQENHLLVLTLRPGTTRR